MRRLTFDGLQAQPGQVWGGVRLVPLVRDEPIESLRLHPNGFPDPTLDDGYRASCCYTPHGLVAEWTDDGAAVPALGTALQMAATTVRKSRKPPTRLERRTRVRFVPHHTAIDAFLPLSYRGPATAWSEWSTRAFNRGLPQIGDKQFPGHAVEGLADALRIFEIHPGQCGVLVYVADALAAAVVTPHPDDYRALHPTLVEDGFGELIWRYANLYREVPDFEVHLDESAIDTVGDLRAAMAAARREWAGSHLGIMAAGLLDTEYHFTSDYWMAPYTLWRFRPRFNARREDGAARAHEPHVGEAITDDDGRLAFLYTFRLSETQSRRARLLEHLADHDWNLEDTAAAMGLAVPALAARIDATGYGDLLRQDVMDRFRAMNVRFGR
ncbi:ARPP-2 domain-containing protein [Glycomyces buryatensis]|uniref:ARG and Rhodanese-Phosphatase-superfamily-associated domain-containing protein n=1 Tax=Glycomyces buryatensis TaxID=2570927 RepID=A0A4V4HR50_9ACTN|nr:hypothetical protein [Glycomyces buryatensis]THV36436.1 hypothetical protein FAB82_21860 [Glycomyces buryatensis]